MSATNEAPASVVPAVRISDPGPLGLAGFALTTFLLSAANANWTKGAIPGVNSAEWLPYALVYGGIVQLLAGMWEFRTGNVFGATAFSSYGAFWMGLFFYVRFVAVLPGENIHNDLGWILLAFAIFTLYMLIASTQTNAALFSVFLALEIALIFLFIGQFDSGNANLIKVGGYLGVVTALIAWYVSAAGLVAGMKGRPVLPVGKPLFELGGRG